MKSSLLLIFLVGVWSAGCSDHVTTSTDMVFDEIEPASPPDEGTTFSFVQENVFDLSCALSGCHSGSTFPDLSSGQAYASIVDAISSQGFKLIAPGDPDNSYLYIKITAGPDMSGSRMPQGGAPLPATTTDAIRDWIERGAPND